MARIGPASTLEPVARLVCLALLSSASLLANAPFSAVVAIGTFLLLLKEGLSPRTIIRQSAFVGVFGLFAALIRFGSIDDFRIPPFAAIENVLSYGVRLLAAYLTGRLFYAATSVSELRDAATRITRRIPILRRLDVGLVLSMILTFIPQIFEEWTATLEASRSRGMPRRGLSRRSLVIAAFLRRLMLRAVSTPEALIARGWSRNRGIAPLSWRLRDSFCSLGCTCIFVAALLRIV